MATEEEVKDVLFIHVPKTGGTSIRGALDMPNVWNRKLIFQQQPHRGFIVFGHQPFEKMVKLGWVTKEFADVSYKFSFVRNPYDRAVSAWLDTCRAGFSGWVNDDQDTANGEKPKHYYIKWAKSVGFIGFCREMYGKPFYPLEPCERRADYRMVFCPQTWHHEGVTLDFIGRFENLEEDFKRLLKDLSIPDRELPWKKRTRGVIGKHQDYRKFYCDESKELVENAYKDEFDAYGYPLWR